MRSLALILALAVAPAAGAAFVDFSISLSVDQATTALPGASGGGSGTATLDTASNLFSWNIGYGGLNGGEIGAHFHGGPPGAPGPIVLSLPSGSPKVGGETVSEGDETAILADLWYVNIHTDQSPGGEIRGQVLRVEPVCGNSLVESGEECDDGNTSDGDGCSADCLVEGPGIPVLPEPGLMLFAVLLLGTSLLMLRHRLHSRI